VAAKLTSRDEVWRIAANIATIKAPRTRSPALTAFFSLPASPATPRGSGGEATRPRWWAFSGGHRKTPPRPRDGLFQGSVSRQRSIRRCGDGGVPRYPRL
jgi:hypothetical protein